MTELASACNACADRRAERFTAREMMFGTREPFEYLLCAGCGSLRIAQSPADLSRHYPPDYNPLRPLGRENGPKRYLRRKWTAHALGERSLPGALLTLIRGRPELSDWVRRSAIQPTDSILDVGCGSGHTLRLMASAGFRSLIGIDPHIARDEIPKQGYVLLKCTLGQITGRFDLVMLHHSFEHMGDPELVLRDVRRVLRPGAVALIRVPVAGSLAWREYGEDWVQLDPPRHLFIPSERGMRLLASRQGFRIDQVIYDSSGFQFWGSEQNRRGIPLRDPRSVASGGGGIFSRSQLRRFEKRAAELNQRGEGDQACFYLRAS